MKLYLISQGENPGYDTYSDAVVCAPDELTARNMNPSSGAQMTAEEWADKYSAWCSSVEHVKAEYIGDAVESLDQGVVCSSFHAG